MCNYTFEFDASRRAGPMPLRAGIGVVLIGVAVAAAVVAGWLAAGASGGRPDAVATAVMLGGGAFALVGALTGWSWFFTSRRARRFVWLFGATGARVFYAAIGGGLTGGAIGFMV